MCGETIHFILYHRTQKLIFKAFDVDAISQLYYSLLRWQQLSELFLLLLHTCKLQKKRQRNRIPFAILISNMVCKRIIFYAVACIIQLQYHNHNVNRLKHLQEQHFFHHFHAFYLLSLFFSVKTTVKYLKKACSSVKKTEYMIKYFANILVE